MKLVLSKGKLTGLEDIPSSCIVFILFLLVLALDEKHIDVTQNHIGHLLEA